MCQGPPVSLGSIPAHSVTDVRIAAPSPAVCPIINPLFPRTETFIGLYMKRQVYWSHQVVTRTVLGVATSSVRGLFPRMTPRLRGLFSPEPHAVTGLISRWSLRRPDGLISGALASSPRGMFPPGVAPVGGAVLRFGAGVSGVGCYPRPQG